MIQLKKLEDNTYEAEVEGYDYHIRLETDGDSLWMVNAFRSAESDANQAHIDTESFDSFQEAIDFILDDGFRE